MFAVLLLRDQQQDTLRMVVSSTNQSMIMNPDAHDQAAMTIKSYRRALEAKELTEEERASLMLAYLQERYGQLPNVLHDVYATFCNAPPKVLDRARDEALSSLGNGAVKDPVFGCLFRPLAREYGALDAQKQMDVYRLLESYYQEVEQAASQPDATKVRTDSYKKLLADAGEVLSTHEYDEFMVRASPLAKATQRMSLNLDDPKFRTLIQLVAKDEKLTQLVLGNVYEPERRVFQNAQVAQLLGNERYVRFSHSVDPIGAGAPVGELGRSLRRRGASTSAEVSVPISRQ